METTSSVLVTYVSSATDMKLWFLSINVNEGYSCFSFIAISIIFPVGFKPVFYLNPLVDS